MDLFYSVMVIEFALQALFLWILLSIFAKKEADIVWVKLMFASMAISLLVFMTHMAFEEFAGPGVLLIDFAFIFLVVRKFFDVRSLRSAAVTICFMFGATAVQLGINYYSAHQAASIGDELAEREQNRDEVTRETFKAMQKTLAGPEHAEEIDKRFEQMEAEAAAAQEPPVTSLGQQMLNLKDLAIDQLRSLRGGESEEALAEKDDEEEAAPAKAEGKATKLLSSIKEKISPKKEADPPASTPEESLPLEADIQPSIPEDRLPLDAAPLQAEEVASDDFMALFPVELPEEIAEAPTEDTAEVAPKEDATPLDLADETASPSSPFEGSEGQKVATKTSPYEIHPLVMDKVVRIRNQSTNPGIPPPSINVSATGTGKRGNYVIADGKMLGIGEIIRVPIGTPSRWRLVKASATIVTWEPIGN